MINAIIYSEIIKNLIIVIYFDGILLSIPYPAFRVGLSKMYIVILPNDTILILESMQMVILLNHTFSEGENYDSVRQI